MAQEIVERLGAQAMGEGREAIGVKRQVASLKPTNLPIAKSVNTSPAFSKNQEQLRIKKLETVEQRITQLEKQLTECSWQMELAGSDYDKLKTLGADYAKIEADLASAWAELEKIG